MSDGLYLLELRQRLLYCFILWLIVFSACVYFCDELFHSLALPLLKALTPIAMPIKNQVLIATTVVAPLWVPLKFSFALSLITCMPYVFYQLWRFIAPALYQQERRWSWTLLVASSLLFYGGIVFVYGVVLPMLFSFFKQFTPDYILFMPDISHYLSFVLTLFFAFGFAFQLPVILLLALKLGMITVTTLVYSRPYVIVLAFIVGMVLTPPDVLSQILLALPLWGLFEVTLLVAKGLKL